MILEKQTQSNILTEGEDLQDTTKMSLDLDSAQMLMQMLSKDLYKDSIGSTIREVTSNALDSHREAKTDKPIIVSLMINASGNYEFTVEDFGTGLNAEDVTNIISKYGKSTRRQSSTSLGMMGLGFKSPLAYCSSFVFIARKDGIERKYMMYEGEDGNAIDLLYMIPSDSPNGVKVIIPVKFEDRHSFLQKIKQQLCYFEDVFFKVNVAGVIIPNTFNIVRADDFQISDMSQDLHLHICLDNVYYPIDYDELGIPRIQIPVGLRFSLRDGIFPIPNRESLKYSKEAKAIITAKIKEVADYFMIEYNRSISSSATFSEVYEFYRDSAREVTINGKAIDITAIKGLTSIKMLSPSIPGIKLLNLQNLVLKSSFLLNDYDAIYEISNSKMRLLKYSERKITYTDLINHPIYVIGKHEKLPIVMREYLKQENRHKTAYIVRKVRSAPLRGNGSYHNPISNYISTLSLGSYPRSQWRQIITEYQSIRDVVLSRMIDIDSVIIPEQWIEDRKKRRVQASTVGGSRRIKLTGEINCKVADRLERYVQNQNCKFVSTVLDISKISKYRRLTVYTTHDRKSDLDNLYQAFRTTVRFITLSDREMKVIENVNIHNLMPYSEFMKGENKPFKRIITAYLIREMISENEATFTRIDKVRRLSRSLAEKLDLLLDYRDKQYQSGSSSLYKILLEVAESHNLFDMNIYHVYKDVKAILDKFKFLNAILKYTSRYGDSEEDQLIQIISDLFKYHKFRINYERYGIKLNEEEQTEDSLTEEEVEDLEQI